MGWKLHNSSSDWRTVENPSLFYSHTDKKQKDYMMQGYEGGMPLRPPHYPLDFNHAHSTVSFQRSVIIDSALCPQVRLQVGVYIVYLMDWLTVFSRKQILVLRLEDHASNMKYTMHKVFDFLNLGEPHITPSGGSDQYHRHAGWRHVKCLSPAEY